MLLESKLLSAVEPLDSRASFPWRQCDSPGAPGEGTGQEAVWHSAEEIQERLRQSEARCPGKARPQASPPLSEAQESEASYPELTLPVLVLRAPEGPSRPQVSVRRSGRATGLTRRAREGLDASDSDITSISDC